MFSGVIAAVEDPGAANMLIGLRDALSPLALKIYAPAAVRTYLDDHGTPDSEELTEDFVDGWDRDQPQALLIGTSENPNCVALQCIARARARGVVTIGLVDAAANAEYRFRGTTDNPLAHIPDHLFVPDEATRQSYVSLGVPVASIHVVGHPRHDAVRRRLAALRLEGRANVKKRLFPQLNDQTVVVFAAEVSDGLDPDQFRRNEQYTLHGSGKTDERTLIVLEELIDALADEARIIVRLHPKNRAAEFASLKDRVAGFHQGGDSVECWYAADAVVGMTSMALVESSLCHTPTLSILPREAERSWLPDAARVPIATNPEEIRHQLRALLAAPASNDAGTSENEELPAAVAMARTIKLLAQVEHA